MNFSAKFLKIGFCSSQLQAVANAYAYKNEVLRIEAQVNAMQFRELRPEAVDSALRFFALRAIPRLHAMVWEATPQSLP
jgi:hypothetical protein